MGTLIAFFAITIAIIFILANLGSIFIIIIKFLFGERTTSYIHFRPIQNKYKRPLEKYFAYYNSLPQKQKKIFEHRVQLFIDLKHFVPRGFGEVMDEMKAIIAASAVQLTFGLSNIYLRHFEKILIYPDDYYSVIFRRYHQGEVNLHGGIIVLSWKNFARGYMDHKDGRNLGLHEMAHALRLENEIDNEEFGFFPKHLLKSWKRRANEIIDDIQNGQGSFFREYAGTNNHEFFAVAIEYFFERSQQFQDTHPDLYQLLVQLLKQDPLLMKTAPKAY